MTDIFTDNDTKCFEIDCACVACDLSNNLVALHGGHFQRHDFTSSGLFFARYIGRDFTPGTGTRTVIVPCKIFLFCTCEPTRTCRSSESLLRLYEYSTFRSSELATQTQALAGDDSLRVQSALGPPNVRYQDGWCRFTAKAGGCPTHWENYYLPRLID